MKYAPYFAFLALGHIATGDVKLPVLFSDHMVLQRDKAVPVWGWADVGEEVSVTLGGQTKNTKAGADGKWRVQLDQLAAGEGMTLTVRCSTAISFRCSCRTGARAGVKNCRLRGRSCPTSTAARAPGRWCARRCCSHSRCRGPG